MLVDNRLEDERLAVLVHVGEVATHESTSNAADNDDKH